MTLRLLLPPSPWRWLLGFTGLVLIPGGLHALGSPGEAGLIFVCCGLGLLPLAVVLSHLVEQLVEHLGTRLGGLASVVLGNLVELLIAFNALASGLYPLVVTSIAGSVVINCLPVLGIGIMVATRGRPAVAVDPLRREIQNQQLMMSAILLALPSIFYLSPLSNALQGSTAVTTFSLYSALVAVLALSYYLLAFVMQRPDAEAVATPATAPNHRAAPLRQLVPALIVITVLVAIVSERLVDALEALVSGAHLSELFVGLFLLPLFGCLPEILVTIRAAARRQIPLVMTNTIDSSLQLLLFVLPLLVLAGIPLGRHLNLGLPPVALACLAVAVLMIERITENHKLNSYEGLQLVLLFVAMALGALLLISP